MIYVTHNVSGAVSTRRATEIYYLRQAVSSSSSSSSDPAISGRTCDGIAVTAVISLYANDEFDPRAIRRITI